MRKKKKSLSREFESDFMMNMEALLGHAYLHREPSAPCQCITCSSEPSPWQLGEKEEEKGEGGD